MSQLVDRHAAGVQAVAYALLGRAHDRTAREDAVQEAFLRAFHQLARLRDAGSFGRWLNGIARRVCIDAVRGRNRGGLRQLPIEAAGEAAGDGIGPASGAAPHAAPVEAETTRAVRDAIDTLPDDLRETVWRFYYASESHEQIAAYTGVRLATVNARLHKARELLRHRLRALAPDIH